MNLIFQMYEVSSKIESKYCAFLKTNVKSAQKYFMHLNWIILAINPCWLGSSMGSAAFRNQIMRVRIPFETTKNSLFSAVLD